MTTASPTALSLSAPLDGLANPSAIIAGAAKSLRLPKRLRLSEWADEKFYLSPESAAEPGRWRTIPYQRGIMDAITDPAVERVSVMKSARVGWTKILDAAIGYYMEQDPCPILAVQPTVEDAEGFSKEEIDPMLRDCPVLRDVVRSSSKRDGKNTILHKRYAGGVLSMVGANSGRGFRRTSRKIIALDEADGYPPSAGNEGDPISLAIKRSEYYWDRKILIGSTPLIAGASRIEEEFRKGDQRRYYVPCPQCGHMDFLTFREKSVGAEPRGHWMSFDGSSPETAMASAVFVCRKNGCIIEHRHKRWMVERGEWRGEKPFRRHASFHIWAAYSYSPNATWGHLAAEFVEANTGGVEKLKTFINTGLGETWTEKGEAPDWQRLYQRRELYARGTVPRGALFLTAGMDVQADRLVYEVVAWNDRMQSWSVDADVIMGDTAKEETWAQADEFLARSWRGEDHLEHRIRVLGVDSGFNTQTVYNWARGHRANVIACKGSATAQTMLGLPKPVDVTYNGRTIARGCKVWAVGVNLVKAEIYGWLKLNPPTTESGAPYPLGFCHFPEYGEEFFKQLTAEHLVKRTTRNGFVFQEWAVIPGRENHFLDCRVYARAAAERCGLSRLAAAARLRGAAPAAVVSAPAAAAEGAPSSPQAEAPQEATATPERPAPARGGWLGDGGGRGGPGRPGGGWIRRR
jgi:terminase, large subunit